MDKLLSVITSKIMLTITLVVLLLIAAALFPESRMRVIEIIEKLLSNMQLLASYTLHGVCLATVIAVPLRKRGRRLLRSDLTKEDRQLLSSTVNATLAIANSEVYRVAGADAATSVRMEVARRLRVARAMLYRNYLRLIESSAFCGWDVQMDVLIRHAKVVEKYLFASGPRNAVGIDAVMGGHRALVHH